MTKFFSGIACTIAVTFLPPVAPWYSQAIYDCGVRIAKYGVHGGTVSNITIEGHRYGVCAPNDTSFEHPVMDATEVTGTFLLPTYAFKPYN